jgi:hypothetical protein
MRPPAQPSWPGLTRPSTRRDRRGASGIGVQGTARLHGSQTATSVRLRAVDGRVKPGHDDVATVMSNAGANP